jgi:general secretion pathway protein L
MADSTTSLQQPLVALQRGGRRFLDWWLRELASMVPQKIHRWWRGTSGLVLLAIDESRAIFYRPSESGIEEILSTEVGENGLSMPVAALRQYLRKAAGQDFLLFVIVPSDQVLQRTLSLPIALAENLRQTLAFELDRFTPFRPDQVYFDYRLADPPAGTTADGTMLTVELVVAPRRAIDQIVSRLTTFGLNVSGAVIKEDIQGSVGRFRNLLPSGSISYQPSSRLRQRVVFAAISVCLLLALLIIPIWQKRIAAIELLTPLAQAKAAAKETDALRERLGKSAEEANFLPAKKWDTPSATLILEELTKLLPDDTFVIQLEFDGKAVQVMGETGSAATMVETIEASPLFKDVAFRSPLTKIQGSPFDRFQIGATAEVAKQSTVAAHDVASQAIAPVGADSPAAPTTPAQVNGAAAPAPTVPTRVEVRKAP